MRAAYRRCEPFLSTVPSRNETETQSKIAKVMLMGLGYTEKELASVDFDDLDVAAFQELVTRKTGQNASSTAISTTIGRFRTVAPVSRGRLEGRHCG